MRLAKLILLFLTAVCSVSSACAGPTTQPFLLHLPGIGGRLTIDDRLVMGLRDGGVDGWLEIHDWTGSDRGLIALMQEQRHDRQSTEVSEFLAKKAHDYPGLHITVTSHSAGCGIAAWALEKLPDDVVIDDWVQMESALSPTYDLSKALHHVRHAYSLYSELDSFVLGTGTTKFGTVDGKKSESAGMLGYTMPAEGDPKQYDKLTQYAYEESWMRFGDIGDHIGPMRYHFAKFMIAPMLKTGKLPKLEPLEPATTRALISSP